MEVPVKWFWWISGVLIYLALQDTKYHWGAESWVYYTVMLSILLIFSTLGELADRRKEKILQGQRDREANAAAKVLLDSVQKKTVK